MDIFIKWKNDTKSVRLPILPENFELTGTQNNQSVMIHNLGEVNLKGKRGLYSITIESFFPHEKLSIQHGKHHDPYDYYIDQLKKLYENNTTVHLIITGTDVSMFCTIESFTYGEEDRSGDVKYLLAFREYRDDALSASSARPKKDIEEESRKWKKGDTWQNLTKSVMGSSKDWKKVRKKNDAVIKKAMKATGKKEKEALVGYKVVITT